MIIGNMVYLGSGITKTHFTSDRLKLIKVLNECMADMDSFFEQIAFLKKVESDFSD